MLRVLGVDSSESEGGTDRLALFVKILLGVLGNRNVTMLKDWCLAQRTVAFAISRIIQPVSGNAKQRCRSNTLHKRAGDS